MLRVDCVRRVKVPDFVQSGGPERPEVRTFGWETRTTTLHVLAPSFRGDFDCIHAKEPHGSQLLVNCLGVKVDEDQITPSHLNLSGNPTMDGAYHYLSPASELVRGSRNGPIEQYTAQLGNPPPQPRLPARLAGHYPDNPKHKRLLTVMETAYESRVFPIHLDRSFTYGATTEICPHISLG